MHSKEDIHKALDGLSQFFSNNIGFVSEGLILNQKEMQISSEDIVGIVTSLMVIRDGIEEKVVAIKHIMDGRPANGAVPEAEY